jgi:hypothetical protein
MSKYKVEGKTFDRLADARQHAESIMAGRHDDAYVMISRKDDDEKFFEPYKRIERESGRFVLR